MEYHSGDIVRVRGFKGAEATMRVWATLQRGLLLCTEDGYQILRQGREAPAVGYPLEDVVGLVESPIGAYSP